jgi:phosphohistidine phosphatase SixA
MRMKTLSIAAAMTILLTSLAHASDPATNEKLFALLKSGGHVVLMRHAETPPGVGDPPGMRIDDCKTQRNLTDEGRRHARSIGDALHAHGVQFDKVLSSPLCRCMDTARLAFGRVDDAIPVGNVHGGNEEMPRQVREMRALATAKRRGGNVVLVSHGTTIAAVTGITPEAGEMLVITPQGEGNFQLMGRLAIP